MLFRSAVVIGSGIAQCLSHTCMYFDEISLHFMEIHSHYFRVSRLRQKLRSGCILILHNLMFTTEFVFHIHLELNPVIINCSVSSSACFTGYSSIQSHKEYQYQSMLKFFCSTLNDHFKFEIQSLKFDHWCCN